MGLADATPEINYRWRAPPPGRGRRKTRDKSGPVVGRWNDEELIRGETWLVHVF